MEDLNAMLDNLAARVSENSDSVSNGDNSNSNSNETANDHEKSERLEPNSGTQDTKQDFKVYTGYGGDYNPMGSDPSSNVVWPATAPGTVQSWPEASATWTSTVTVTTALVSGTVTATVKPTGPPKTVWSATARTALATPREVGECGRKHKWDTTDWGPGKGWNMCTLPVYRSPSSPCNRLFSAIKETRPGRNPEALLEWLNFTPHPTSARNTPAAHLRLTLGTWNSSTTLSAPPTHRRKLHHDAETSSLENGRSPGRRQWQLQQQTVEHASTPSKNEPGSKLSKAIKEWKPSTNPEWKNTVKWNQFENIKDIETPPPVHNQYTGVKAQYMKPSKKYLRLKKERELEAQRREHFRELDIKYCDAYRDKRARMANQKIFLEDIGRVVSSSLS